MLQFPRLLHFSSTLSDLEPPSPSLLCFPPFLPCAVTHSSRALLSRLSPPTSTGIPRLAGASPQRSHFRLHDVLKRRLTLSLCPEKSTRNDPASFSPSTLLSFSSTDLPFLSHRFLLILIVLLSLYRGLYTRFLYSPASISSKMSPSLSRMSARVQAEFHVGSQTMSLPLEMLDNIGHRGSSMELEVDNSYKSSKIKRERLNREVDSIDLGSEDMFICLCV